MQTITIKVGSASSGRDYATLSAAWAAIPADLVAADVSYVVEMYPDSEFTLTANVILSGKTTDAGHTITIRPAAGLGYTTNANILTNALRYNLANGVGINAGNYFIQNQNANTTVDGLQVRSGTNLAAAAGGLLVDSADTAVIQNCLVEYCGSDTTADLTLNKAFCASLHRGVMRNIQIILTQANSNGVRLYQTTSALGENITVCRLGNLARSGYGFYQPYSGYAIYKTMRNCAVFGATFSNTSQGTYINCASDGTFTSGTNTLQNVTAASVFVDPINDFRYLSTAPLIDVGAQPSADNVTTISGNRQQGTSADIGAWEFPQAVQAPTAKITSITVSGTSVTIAGTFTGSVTSGQASIAPLALTGNNAVAQGPVAITIGTGTFTATFSSCKIGKYTVTVTVSNSAYTVQATNDQGGFEIIGPRALSIVQDPIAGQVLTLHGTCTSATSGNWIVPAAATNPNGAIQQSVALTIDLTVTPNTYTASVTLAPGNYDPGTLTFTNADGTSLPQGGTSAVTIYAISGSPDAPAQSAPDTVPPTMSGTMTISGTTSTGMTATWTAGTDDVGVVAYEFSQDNQVTWTNIGNVLSKTLTGLTPSTLYQLAVRAVDPGNNKSNILAAQDTTLAPTTTTGSRTVSLSLVNTSDTPAANLTGLRWSWFDAATPDLFAAPTDKGTIETTDSAGVLMIPLPGSQLAVGGIGWLIVTNSTGDPAFAHSAFSGPLAVA